MRQGYAFQRVMEIVEMEVAGRHVAVLVNWLMMSHLSASADI